MSHQCYTCGGPGPFSANQKKKGEFRNCSHCLSQGAGYVCTTCNRGFHDANSLTQHEKTHLPKNFACPGCGIKKYRGLTNALLHFESGSCSACLGRDNASRVVYQQIKSQAGGENFLVANTRLLTLSSSGALQSGYQAGHQNYICRACSKTFEHASAMTQHIANRPQCMAIGSGPNLQIGHNSQPKRLKFFHGTTRAKADRIFRGGFIVSEDGLLGRGVYCAREDKARKFALLRASQIGEYEGGMVELHVTVRNAKYVVANDRNWQREGYDACRADMTSNSTNMEWCIADPNAITVHRPHAVYA